MSPESEARNLKEWLAEVRAEYWQRLAVTDVAETAAGDPHVLFELGGRLFAVEASLCKGVVRKTRVARLPGVTSHVLGIVGIRGEVISATDPAVLLRIPGDGAKKRRADDGYFLVLSKGPLKAALWVDWVDDVVSVDRERLLPLESPWAGVPEGVLLGQWQGRSPPVHVLDGGLYLELSAVRSEEPSERA